MPARIREGSVLCHVCSGRICILHSRLISQALQLQHMACGSDESRAPVLESCLSVSEPSLSGLIARHIVLSPMCACASCACACVSTLPPCIVCVCVCLVPALHCCAQAAAICNACRKETARVACCSGSVLRPVPPFPFRLRLPTSLLASPSPSPNAHTYGTDILHALFCSDTGAAAASASPLASRLWMYPSVLYSHTRALVRPHSPRVEFGLCDTRSSRFAFHAPVRALCGAPVIRSLRPL